jgi:hypothetical protein
MLSNEEKAVVVPCSLADGEACSALLGGAGRASPYDCIPDVARALGGEVEKAVLRRVDGEFMSLVYIKPASGATVKVSSDNPAMAVNVSLASDCPLLAEKNAWLAAASAEQAVLDLASMMHLWPLPPLEKTSKLKFFSSFMERVMPKGSVFVK